MNSIGYAIYFEIGKGPIKKRRCLPAYLPEVVEGDFKTNMSADFFQRGWQGTALKIEFSRSEYSLRQQMVEQCRRTRHAGVSRDGCAGADKENQRTIM